MGSGKTRTVAWLHEARVLPLESFVRVDPDDIRQQLPEYREYIKREFSSAGDLTQKESGYIAEIMIHASLARGANVLVEGSLKDSNWYVKYIDSLKKLHPLLRIAIIHVSAPLDVCLQRVFSRAMLIGRLVPSSAVVDSYIKVQRSVKIIRRAVDLFMRIDNPSDGSLPVISELIRPPLMSDINDDYAPASSTGRTYFHDEYDENMTCSESEKIIIDISSLSGGLIWNLTCGS